MRVVTNGTELHVAVRDPGRPAAERPAIVLLHYFAGSARAWDGVVDHLADQHPCIAPDLRGHGDSSAPQGGYAVDDGADDVAGVVATLGIRAYVLVGHSMGGKIALAVASRRPPGLQALVLVAPSPPTPEPIADDKRRRLLRAWGDRAAAVATADRIVAHPLAAAARERVVADSLRTSPAAWRAWLAHGSREDVSALAADVAVPTLVIAGAADQTIPRTLLAREVVPRIADTRLVTVPDAAHLLPLEAPAAIADLIRMHCLVAAPATDRAPRPSRSRS